MTRNRIRIVCVDDHSVVRTGVAAMVANEHDMVIVASVQTGEEGVAAFKQHTPDIVLMDLKLPKMSGFEAIRAIRHADPQARIIVLTMYHGDEDIYRAMEAGASSYLLKDTLPDTLIDTIRKTHAGRTAIAPVAAAQLAKRVGQPALTAREIEVLRCLAKGARNKEIAETLGISPETVIAHLRTIFGKLQVHDRTAALSVALKRGIIHLD